MSPSTSKLTFEEPPWRDRKPRRRTSSPEHQTSRSNSGNNNMATHAAGPSRIDRRTRKGHQRSNNLTLSLSPRVPPGMPIASPHKPSTARSMPASMTSPEPTSSRVPSVNRMAAAATANTSPDSFCPFSPSDVYRLRQPVSRDASSYRPTSSATVRGPSMSERGATPPLTPFPPWISDSEDEQEEQVVQVRRWEGPNAVEALTLVKNRGEALRHNRPHTIESRPQWLLHSIIDGVILVLQTTTALGVLSALISITAYQRTDLAVDLWVWSCLGVIILLCSGSLVVHEARVLSIVALLYLQAAILAATTATGLMLWARCLAEENRVVRGLVMGCNVFMWGLSLFGFARAVVLWTVEDEDERERERRVEYGTFAA